MRNILKSPTETGLTHNCREKGKKYIPMIKADSKKKRCHQTCPPAFQEKQVTVSFVDAKANFHRNSRSDKC